MTEKMIRVTLHSQRQGTSAKHNDRSFDLTHAAHIDQNLSGINLLWSYKDGPYIGNSGRFEAVEMEFYSKTFKASVEAQNARNDVSRHSERNKSTDDLYEGRNTRPDEILIYLGGRDQHADPAVLWQVWDDYRTWMMQSYPNVNILTAALHLDEEGAPHLHVRQVYIGHDRDGHAVPSQTKALAEMGIKRPDPSKKTSRCNNAKMTFTAICRKTMQDIAIRHGLNIEDVPRSKDLSGRSLPEFQKAADALGDLIFWEAERDRVKMDAIDAVHKRNAAVAQTDALKRKADDLSREVEDGRQEMYRIARQTDFVRRDALAYEQRLDKAKRALELVREALDEGIDACRNVVAEHDKAHDRTWDRDDDLER